MKVQELEETREGEGFWEASVTFCGEFRQLEARAGGHSWRELTDGGEGCTPCVKGSFSRFAGCSARESVQGPQPDPHGHLNPAAPSPLPVSHWPVWLSWLQHHPVNQKSAGSIPGRDTCLGCRLGHRLGHVGEATDGYFSFISMFLSFSLFLPSPLSKINKYVFG